VTAFPAQVVTPRLLLRLWEPADAPALREAVNASLDHLRPWMPWAVDQPVEAWRETVARFRTEWDWGTEAVYGAFLDGAVAGGFGLHHRGAPGTLEIGYWLRADQVGHGYATELAAALTGTALALPGIDVVEIHHDRANWPSRGVPERLGYAWAGEYPLEARAPGETGVHDIWRTDADRWTSRNGGGARP
jgi:ribosomal-protein-serine acetyltransferase